MDTKLGSVIFLMFSIVDLKWSSINAKCCFSNIASIGYGDPEKYLLQQSIQQC